MSPELQALHELVQQKVVTLLSDPENIVKQSLLENGITRLCVFFGRQKANDVLLSHMITFLNDKSDWHLRAAFFDSIVGERRPPTPPSLRRARVTLLRCACRGGGLRGLAELVHP